MRREPRTVEDARTLRSRAELVELAPAAIVVRGIGSGAIVYWNRGAEEMYGWARAEALGRVSHELLRTEFPRPLAEVEAELDAHGRWEGELIHITRDGRRLLVFSRWAVQHDEHGQPSAYVENNTDLTEQTRLLRQA